MKQLRRIEGDQGYQVRQNYKPCHKRGIRSNQYSKRYKKANYAGSDISAEWMVVDNIKKI